jgi:hypothetical protein
MIRKAVAVLAWLAAGHLVLAGLFWGLVNTPESNAAMLALSLLIVLALVALGGIVEGTAGAWLLPGRSFREAVAGGVRAIPAFVLAGVLLGIVWWVGGRIDAWHAAHAGEIDAWFMAKFQAPNEQWPHRLIDVVVFVLRYIVGISLAVALLFASLEGGLRAVARFRWFAAGLSRDQVMLVAIGVTLFMALPWRFVMWRPEDLPVSWVQPAFAGAKLGLIYLSLTLGWGLCLLAGARNASAR